MHALYDQQTASVVTTWGSIPPQVIWPDGAATHGAAVGHVHADRWSIVDAVYVDAGQPSPHHTEASRSSAYANGRIEITRVWSLSKTIEQLKAAYHAAVDADAERTRLKYITPGDGMQMTYREKFEQAQGVNAMGETAANALTEQQRLASFPTLAASVGTEAVSLWAAAQLVLQKYTQFAQLSYVIESKRLSGKKAISEASTAEAVKAAYEAVTWEV